PPFLGARCPPRVAAAPPQLGGTAGGDPRFHLVVCARALFSNAVRARLFPCHCVMPQVIPPWLAPPAAAAPAAGRRYPWLSPRRAARSGLPEASSGTSATST